MKPQVLTDEQVQMLIEDGTLQPAIEQADDLKTLDEMEAMLNDLEQSQANALPDELFEKYNYFMKMLILNMHYQPQNVHSLYIYRNALIGRYQNLVHSFIRDAEYIIDLDLRKYNIFNSGHYGSTLFDNIISKFESLEAMNYFAFSMDNAAIYTIVQGIIERYGVSFVCCVDNNKTQNVASLAYRYFNDIANIINFVIKMAQTFLLSMGNYDPTNINPEDAVLICQPSPLDMSERIDSTYNRMFEYNHPKGENDDIPKKRMYTFVEE